MLLGEVQPSDGSVVIAPKLRIGYVAQVQDERSGLSGGQRVNRAISQAMAMAPDLLLLDEPTNHLDAENRRSLSRMLQGYYGTVVMVTHDHELMNQTCDILWHIGHGRVEVFDGRYADYLAEQQLKRNALEKQLSAVKRAKQDAHDALMQEQERAAHARQRGIKSIQDRKWATVKSPTKLGRANTTAGRKQAEIREEQQFLSEQLARLQPPEVIVPQFHLDDGARVNSLVLQIGGGAAVGHEGQPILGNILITLRHGERLALTGPNGCVKSTLARAILGDAQLRLDGDWLTPATSEIGYVDQHYDNLDQDATVLEHAVTRRAPVAGERGAHAPGLVPVSPKRVGADLRAGLVRRREGAAIAGLHRGQPATPADPGRAYQQPRRHDARPHGRRPEGLSRRNAAHLARGGLPGRRRSGRTLPLPADASGRWRRPKVAPTVSHRPIQIAALVSFAARTARQEACHASRRPFVRAHRRASRLAFGRRRG